MDPIRIETIVESDGELHLSDLPCHKGDHVEALIHVRSPAATRDQDAARQRFLERARQSRFRSPGPYPTRDELHDLVGGQFAPDDFAESLDPQRHVRGPDRHEPT